MGLMLRRGAAAIGDKGHVIITIDGRESRVHVVADDAYRIYRGGQLQGAHGAVEEGACRIDDRVGDTYGRRFPRG